MFVCPQAGATSKLSALHLRRTRSSGHCRSRPGSIYRQLSRCGYSCSKNRITLLQSSNFLVDDLSVCPYVRQLRHFRRYVTDDCFHSLVVSLLHSRLDYDNFVLVGCPAYLQRQLQSVLNYAAACLMYRLRRCDHVNTADALATRHWLHLPEQVHDFKVAVMAFRVLHGLAPPYLNQLVRVVDLPGCC